MACNEWKAIFSEKGMKFIIFISACLSLLYFSYDIAVQYVEKQTVTEVIREKPNEAEFPSFTLCYGILQLTMKKEDVPRQCLNMVGSLYMCGIGGKSKI